MASPFRPVQVAPDIKISAKLHEKLIMHIRDRMQFSRDMRDARVELFETTDRELANYLIRDLDDRKRQRENRRGQGPAG